MKVSGGTQIQMTVRKVVVQVSLVHTHITDNTPTYARYTLGQAGPLHLGEWEPDKIDILQLTRKWAESLALYIYFQEILLLKKSSQKWYHLFQKIVGANDHLEFVFLFQFNIFLFHSRIIHQLLGGLAGGAVFHGGIPLYVFAKLC